MPLLDDARSEYRSLKSMADRALAQVPDEALDARLDGDSNTLAVLIRHVAGNLRSRWADILLTDGEKADRDRDAEFETAGVPRAELLAQWERAWDVAFVSMSALSAADLDRTITIRGVAHTVQRALLRNLSHTAQHVGQIVLLAKHHAGASWHELTIPKGQSKTWKP